MPAQNELGQRLPVVLAVVFLLFTEGHTATASEALIRPELCSLAVELGDILVELMPDEAEVLGLPTTSIFRPLKGICFIAPGNPGSGCIWNVASANSRHCDS